MADNALETSRGGAPRPAPFVAARKCLNEAGIERVAKQLSIRASRAAAVRPSRSQSACPRDAGHASAGG